MPISNELLDFNTRYYLSESLSHVLSVFGTDCIIDGLRTINLNIDMENIVSFDLTPGQAIIDSTLVDVLEQNSFSMNVTSFSDNSLLALVLSFKYLRTGRPNFASLNLQHVNESNYSNTWNSIRDRIIIATYHFNKTNKTIQIQESDLTNIVYRVVNDITYEVRPYPKLLRSLSHLIGTLDLALLNTKVDKEPGMGLSSNDFTNYYVDKINNLTDVDLSSKVDVALLAQPDGVATLDSSAKIPLNQLPDSILGQMEYMGTWNPETNDPELSETPEPKGHYYIASEDGSRFGFTFTPGDWLISNGDHWNVLNQSGGVVSVNDKTGIVTITKTDLGLSNVDNTSDINKPISNLTQIALNNKLNLDQHFPSNLTFFAAGELEPETIVGIYITPYPIILNTTLNKSKAFCNTPPTNSNVIYTIYKNHAPIGTVTFNVNVSTGIFDFTDSIINFAINDIVSIRTQASSNPSIMDVVIVLSCSYTASML